MGSTRHPIEPPGGAATAPRRPPEDPDHENPFALSEAHARQWCERNRVDWAEFFCLSRSGGRSRIMRWSKSRRAFVSRSMTGEPNVYTYWDRNAGRVVEFVEPAEVVFVPGWLGGAAR